jgi:hypothetical protein
VDAFDVLKVCLRRWYVVVPVIVVALGAGFGLAWQQKPTYTAFAGYALVYHNPISSSSTRDPRDDNPLAVDGAVLLGEALTADFMSGPTQAALGGVGNSGVAPGQADNHTSYSVSLPQNSQSYLVQTWGKDPNSLRTVVESVLNTAPIRAAEIQNRAGAPKRSQYTTFVTSMTQVVDLPPTSKVKLLVAVLGVGILAGSALSLLVDRMIRSHQEKRRKTNRSVLGQPPVVWWPLDDLDTREESDLPDNLDTGPPEIENDQVPEVSAPEPAEIEPGKEFQRASESETETAQDGDHAAELAFGHDSASESWEGPDHTIDGEPLDQPEQELNPDQDLFDEEIRDRQPAH